jgi:hypothetical protein
MCFLLSFGAPFNQPLGEMKSLHFHQTKAAAVVQKGQKKKKKPFAIIKKVQKLDCWWNELSWNPHATLQRPQRTEKALGRG